MRRLLNPLVVIAITVIAITECLCQTPALVNPKKVQSGCNPIVIGQRLKADGSQNTGAVWTSSDGSSGTTDAWGRYDLLMSTSQATSSNPAASTVVTSAGTSDFPSVQVAFGHWQDSWTFSGGVVYNGFLHTGLGAIGWSFCEYTDYGQPNNSTKEECVGLGKSRAFTGSTEMPFEGLSFGVNSSPFGWETMGHAWITGIGHATSRVTWRYVPDTPGAIPPSRVIVVGTVEHLAMGGTGWEGSARSWCYSSYSHRVYKGSVCTSLTSPSNFNGMRLNSTPKEFKPLGGGFGENYADPADERPGSASQYFLVDGRGEVALIFGYAAGASTSGEGAASCMMRGSSSIIEYQPIR